MDRGQLAELHYIAPIDNVASIVRRGLLSHSRAQRHHAKSIASPTVQGRRSQTVVPNGRPLHEYVNLYICARNPMLFSLKAQHASLAVLRVDLSVLDWPHTVITSQNASSSYVRFYRSPDGLEHLDYNLVFAEWWKHPGNVIETYQHKSIKCAEVLVPDSIAPELIFGAYVSNSATAGQVTTLTAAANANWRVDIDHHLFFQ